MTYHNEPDNATPATAPDPGGPFSRRWAMILAVVGALLFIGIQNMPRPAPEPDPDNAEAEAPAAVQEEPFFDTFARIVISLRTLTRHDPNTMRELDRMARTDASRVRTVVAAGEIHGPEHALEHADHVQATLAPDSPRLEDLELLRRVYRDGPETLDDDERRLLVERHAWFGEVALTHGMEDDAPERRALLGGGVLTLVVLGGFGLVAIITTLAGIVLFIVAMIALGSGRLRPRMPVPAQGGSVFLETFALFCWAFLALQVAGLIASLLLADDDGGLDVAALLLPWLLLLVPLWPLIRGMTWKRWCGTIGLHPGRGLAREIGAGVVGYLAGLPLFIAGVACAIILSQLWIWITGAESPPAPDNPILERIMVGDPLAIAMLFLLATVWAPLCEELIFRGALYRHMRARTGILLAGLATAVVFAFVHSYGPLFTPPLIALGFVFAMLREWRGSLVASITAHALHNAVVISLIIFVVRNLGV